METQPHAKYRSCGATATLTCVGCMDAPEYEPGDSANTVYCNRECQKNDWPTYKRQCNIMRRRRKLLRAAKMLKAALLTYRECALPFMYNTKAQREGKDLKRKGRLHFAAFVSAHVGNGCRDLVKDVQLLDGSASEFRRRLDGFVHNLKLHMRAFGKQEFPVD